MRLRLLMLLVLLGVTTAVPAQIAIGINFSLFPELVQVPNYPVYYASAEMPGTTRASKGATRDSPRDPSRDLGGEPNRGRDKEPKKADNER